MAELASQLTTALADRYRIESHLGEGGMATVYLAEDLKHQRKVAVKVLKPELAAVLGGERFSREITTTAGLRHPNILPLFDSGQARLGGPGGKGTGDGGVEVLYYVMPFVEGESLRDRIHREKQLPVDEAVRIADEVADALHYAHARGVIHRDIKPDNILLEHGRAVVADFGIAQAVSASGGEKLTMTGVAVGTPVYMSPEQASGESVDGRSDLYALGCLLYEMLAGQPPFTGPTAMAVMARHLTDPIPDLSTVRSTVPRHVVAAIARALAKTPADRPATVAEWRQMLASPTAAETAVTAVPTVLKLPPAPATPLLGREEQLARANDLLGEGTRVITITGVGGTGKTRFAVELFRQVHANYAGGAAFVSLASVTDATAVMDTVGITLDIAEAEGRSALDAVATVIGDRHVLLLLDNLEQVIKCAGDIAELVARCPALAVVATSRAPLKIGAEVELALPPLDLPEKGATEADELAHCPSVELFLQRAAKVKSGFSLSAANAVSVAEICRKLDGLPLALELAAARVRILEPAALLQRLDHALDLLTSGDRDLPLRQRTLRATISWSYSLLEESEQRLLRRLSAFQEGCTLDALERVCYDESKRIRALDELDSLVEKGLVRVVDGGERYALLETIRAFAAEQLHAGGESESVRDAHARFFVSFMQGVDDGIQGGDQEASMRRGRAEIANTLAALQWLIARARAGEEWALEQGLLLCGYCGFFWHMVGLHLVGLESVEVLLALARDKAPSRGRALAYFTKGMVSANTGEPDATIAEWTRMGEDGRAVGDDGIVAMSQTCTGYMMIGIGRVEEAAPFLDAAVAYGNEAGHEFISSLARTFKGMQLYLAGDLEAGESMVQSARRIQVRIQDFELGGVALSFLAQMTFSRGDFTRALELYREALDAFGVVGDKPEIARVQCEMGYTALSGADLAEARTMFQRALRTYDEVGSAPGTGQALLGLAATEAAAGDKERAVTIAAAAQAMSERMGVVVEHPMAPGMVDSIEALRASIPKQELDELVSSGTGLSPAEVLAMCGA